MPHQNRWQGPSHRWPLHISTQYFRIHTEREYPLHKKYDLQDVYSVKYKAIIKDNRLQWDDKDFNVDLPVFFVYHRDNQHWTLAKGPPSKNHDECWYSYIEKLIVRRNLAVTPLGEVEDHHFFVWCRQVTLARRTLSRSNRCADLDENTH